MAIRIIILLLLAMFLYPSQFDAQERNISIKLVDRDTGDPIIGAHYKFNEKVGVSDTDGFISLKFNKVGILELSHIQYGNWSLDTVELEKAIQSGVIYKREEAYSLQPVTVIAIHPKFDEREVLGFDSHDKLSHDGGSVLNQSPAISSIRKSGNYGFDPILRGFKYDQLNIVIGGAQTAAAACPNRMDPPISQVAPNMMEHVEIFKGPHSLRYGSSFGGTINFVPAPPNFSLSQKLYGRISGSTETNGEIYRSEGVVGYSLKKMDIAFFGSFSKGRDYESGDGSKIPARFQRLSLGVKLAAELDSDNTINISAVRNLAEDVDFPALPMDLTYDKTTLMNINHIYRIDGDYLKSWNTALFTTLVNHQMDNFSKNLNPRMINALTDAETISYGGRSEGNWIFGDSKLYAGADLRIEKASGDRKREFIAGMNAGNTVYDNVWNGGQISKIGIFGEYNRLFSSFSLIVSGRMEYNIAEATDLNDKFNSKNNKTDKEELNPSISIGVLKNIDNNITLGLWLGRAQRSGSLTELFINSFPVGLDPYDMLGNPSLEPEVNNQLDLTFRYNSNKTIVDLSAFGSLLKNYISSEIDADLTPTMPSSPGVRRFTNISDAYMLGFEVSWGQGLFYGLQHNLSIAYTYGQDKVRNEPLPEIAPLDLRYIVKGNFVDNKINPEISFRHVLKQDRISNAFGESETPSFSLVDFRINYQFSQRIGTTFGIQNIFNENYYEHLTRNLRGTQIPIYAPGRNIYLSLSVDFMEY